MVLVDDKFLIEGVTCFNEKAQNPKITWFFEGCVVT